MSLPKCITLVPISTMDSQIEKIPMQTLSVFQVQGGLSPATSEMNLYSMNYRSTSPVGVAATANLVAPRTRFSTYDTLRRRPEVNTQLNPVGGTRSGTHAY